MFTKVGILGLVCWLRTRLGGWTKFVGYVLQLWHTLELQNVFVKGYVCYEKRASFVHRLQRLKSVDIAIIKYINGENFPRNIFRYGQKLDGIVAYFCSLGKYDWNEFTGHVWYFSSNECFLELSLSYWFIYTYANLIIHIINSWVVQIHVEAFLVQHMLEKKTTTLQ